MLKRLFVAVLVVFGVVSTASAVSIQVDVIDSLNISLTFSGNLNGPEPDFNTGILFIDTPVAGTVHSSYTNISGDAMLGSYQLFAVFSGYSNSPYDGTLQLRNSPNGVDPLAVGDLLSGSANITFNTPHQMTQSMFDGTGVPIYWGTNATSIFDYGTLQGYATSGATVPEPSTIALFGSGLLCLAFARRKGKSK